MCYQGHWWRKELKMIYKHSSVPLNRSLVAIWRLTFFFNQCWTRLASFLGNFLLSNSRLHASINSFSVDSDHPVENQTWRIDLDLAWFKIIWYRTLHLTIDTMEESTPTIEYMHTFNKMFSKYYWVFTNFKEFLPYISTIYKLWWINIMLMSGWQSNESNF